MKSLTAASLSPTGERLKTIFLRLLERFGPRFWWPAETPFEVCIGAILTQNTAWTNVEKAISAMKGAGVLTVEGIEATPAGRLAELIRPATTTSKARGSRVLWNGSGSATEAPWT